MTESSICVEANLKRERTITFYLTLTFVVFSIGIMLGYYTAKESATSKDDTLQYNVMKRQKRSACQMAPVQTTVGKTFHGRFLERYNKKYACVNTREECWRNGIPRNYAAYHLNRKQIKIDGKLDEDAWKEVPWSEAFVDIRSEIYPKPYYDSKFKMRWSDDKLYVGALIQEHDLWATQKVHDSELWTENSFSILIDVDGSLHNYKQVEVNVLGTVMDLLMYKSYWDAPGEIAHDLKWESNAEIGIHTDGTINMPGDKDTFWSVEISIPFHTLSERANRPQIYPTENEVWFLQLARSEQRLMNINGRYEKAPNSTTNWLTWQPCDAVNLHLQDRWGLVQFKRNLKDTHFTFPRWHIYKALFETLEAQKLYKAKNGVYTDAIEELDIPPYLLSRTCVNVPEIRLLGNNRGADFDIAVKSMLLPLPPSYIRSDKFVTI